MTYSQDPVTALDFRVLFESAPNLYLVLTPDLTIVAASDAFLRTTQTEREDILGRNIFDVFPSNSEKVIATGVSNLRESLEHVLKHRVKHTMAVQKYDVRRPESTGGGFEKKYWSASNSPVFGANGEITHIIHQVEDVTEFVQLKQQGNKQLESDRELQNCTAQMEAEIYLRSQQLQEVNRQLCSANEALAALDRDNLEMNHVRQEVSSIEVERTFLAAVLLQMPAAVTIAEAPSGRLLLSNDKVEKILCHPVLSIANFVGYDQYKGFYPDGRPYKFNDWPLSRAVFKGEVVVGEEIDYQCGDGARRTLYANAAPICDRSGQIIAGVLTFEDITERKQAEKALQQINTNLENLASDRTAQLQQALDFEATLKRLADKVHDSLNEEHIIQTAVQELTLVLGIICCDAALYDLEAQTSTICYSYTASSSKKTLITPSSIGHVVQMADLSECYRQLLQGQYFQCCYLTSDPIRSQMVVLSCPIVDDRTVLGDLWLFNYKNYAFDELEIQLVQQVANQCAIAIRQARLYATATAQVEELEKLNALKDDFLSTVSHELRTPITNMKMAIQMLKISPTPEKRSRYLEILHAECDRESQLIDELLDLQRLEVGSYSLFLNESINLEEMVADMIEPFLVRTGQRQQTLQINLPPDLPPLISDRASLERILAELLNNACKYTPAGGEIVLSICCQSPVAATLFTVSNPVEIPENQLPHIFDKFYRIPNADPWKQGGTGLGLALVQKLTEQLQGTIEVESSQGWTTFSVRLPDRLVPQSLTIDP